MSEAKIRLSQKEMEIATDAELILTKNSILEKADLLLGSLLEKQRSWLDSEKIQLPGVNVYASPKISKGEYYMGLPYRLLDHPRLFKQQDIVAIRTMFWWGNSFSSTLHLSGSYKINAEQKILSAITELKANGFFICVNDDPWEHHFQPMNYKPLGVMNNEDVSLLIGKNSFIKLANKIPVKQWDDAEEILLSHFQQLIRLIAD